LADRWSSANGEAGLTAFLFNPYDAEEQRRIILGKLDRLGVGRIEQPLDFSGL